MADFEVHIDLDGRTRPIGLARSNRVRGTETILFEYEDAWLEDPDRFSLEPALALTRGPFAPLPDWQPSGPLPTRRLIPGVVA
jgi:serine/threonine-protein kinase HipA